MVFEKKGPVLAILFLVALVGAGGGGLLWRLGGGGALAVVNPVYGPVIDAVSGRAVVEPQRWSEVAPVRTGRIIDVLFNEGVRVDAGVPLARMDDSDLRAQLAEASSDVAFRQGARDQAGKLLAEGKDDQQHYDALGKDLAQALSRQKMLEEQIRQMTIVAPINGMILWRDAAPGDVRQSGQTIFWIGEPKPLRLNAEIEDQDIPRIRNGQRVLITAESFPGQVLQGAVSSVTPKGGASDKNYRVFISLPEDTPLKIGMAVEADTIVDFKADAMLVPVGAVRDGAVWVARAARPGGDEYVLRKVSVAAGMAGKTAQEVRGDLNIDDLVLADPPSGLAEGAEVHIRKKAWPDLEAGGVDAVVAQARQAGLVLTPVKTPASPWVAGAGAPASGGCNQSYSTAQTTNPGDDKYTKLRKEWQSRGTCFPNIAPQPAQGGSATP